MASLANLQCRSRQRDSCIKPSSCLKRIYLDSVVFTARQLEALMNVFGADHLLKGTDYPHDIAESDPIAHLASLGAISSSAFAAIAGCHARQLFGLWMHKSTAEHARSAADGLHYSGTTGPLLGMGVIFATISALYSSDRGPVLASSCLYAGLG